MRRTTLLVSAVALALAAALSGPSQACAQLRDAKVLTAAGVKNALAAAEAEAQRNGWNVSIAVVDAHGDLLAFHRMDGASLPSIDIALAKARTSARGGQPSKTYADRLSGGNMAILALDFMPLQGGVPIVVEGVRVGAIGVSGVTSAQDEQIALAGAAAVTP